MSVSREAIFNAILAQLNAYVPVLISPVAAPISRRLALADNSPRNSPSIYIRELDELYEQPGKGLPPIRTMRADIICYAQIPKTDATTPGGFYLNPLIDAVEAALTTLTGTDNIQGYLTLGGLVDRCWISGSIIKETGEIDADGQAIAVIPVSILVP